MRDKVKRFLSILMTALMLVNLLPVGALAEGVMISNSVQSKVSLTADSGTAPIETGHVYVYVKIDGASPETLAKFKLNSSGWYTIGSIAKTMPGKGEWEPYWYGGGEWVITPTPSDTKTYQPGDNTGAGVLPAYSIVGLKPWEDNKLIPLGNVRWTGYKLTTGANNYQPESIFSWHMDGIVNFKDINVPYTVKHVVRNSSPEIVLKEETKNQKYGQMTDATKLEFEGYKHVGKIENQIIGDDPITIYVYYEPDDTTVPVIYKTSEGGTITNGGTYNIQPVTGNLSGGGRLPSSTPTADAGYEFVGWERDDGQTYNDLNDVYSKLNQKTADAGTYTLYQNTTFTARFKKNGYKLKINYVYEDGSKAAVSHEDTLSYPYSYNVNSPVIPGYKADKSVVTGTLTEDTTVTVIYRKRNDLSYTVNYYWNGTTEKVATSKTFDGQTFGKTVEASPATIEGYTITPESNKKKSIKIIEGKNEINFYYYENVKLEANSKTVPYHGQEQGVSGFTGAPEGSDFSNITVGAKGTNVGEYPANFADGTVGTVDATGKYIVTKAINGKLKITPVTDEVVVKIAGNTKTETYNGKEHSVEGYTVTSISNPLYTANDFTFTGTAEAKGTNAGTYPMGLKAEQFSNNNENFKKVTFVVEDGSLTINKRNVVLTSETASKTYDGTALTRPVVAVAGDGFVDGEVAGIAAEGEVTHVSEGEVTNTITYTPVDGKFDADNYTITKNEGKLWITPLDGVVVTIEGRTKTVTYNGEEHTAWQYDVIDISNPLYKTAPDEVPNFWNKNAKGARGTDAGTYAMGWKAADFENTNTNFSNVTFVVTDGKLVINPRPVTLTSADLTKVYDGTPLKNGDAPVTEMSGTEKAFPDGEGLDYTFTGGQTDVGKSANTFTYKAKEGTNPDNYAITTEFGTLEVTPVTDKVTVKIKGKTDSVMYDGKLHFVFGFDAESSNKLYNPNKDMWFNGTDVDMIAEGTDAGTYTMGLEVSDFKNKSDNFTNVRFEVVEDGKLEIKKRSVKLTSASDEKVYDGKPLTNETVAVGGDGFADGEGATYDFTGSQTDVGESDNLFTFEVNANTNKDNYTFEVAIGTLKVNPVTDKVTVTVTEKSDTVMYDGMPHTVSGYASMTADNPLYDVEDSVDDTPNAKWAANGTDAGEYPLGIEARDFKNTNANFTNVEFVVVDGALKIDPAPVTLQAPIASKTYDGTPLKAEDYGHSFVEGLDFADDFAAVILTGSQTLVGSSSSLITEVIPKEGKKLKNYKFTFLPGTLTVTDGTGDDPVKPENVVTKTHIPKDMGYNLGEPVTFTISVKNIYNTPKTITLTEKENVKFSNGESVIVFNDVPAGETVTAEATYTITSADILAGVFHNTVTADFTGGGSWTAEDTVTTAELDTTLNVTKTSDVPEGQKAALGQKITYTIKVQNAGNVPYTNVKVEDPLTKLTSTIETLAVGETRTFTTEYVVTEADVLEGHVLNTATATGDEIKDPKSDEPKEPNGGDEVETPTFAPITIKPKDVTATYNGAAITGKDVEITSGKLLEGHKLSAAVDGSGVNAGSYALTINPEKIKIVDANNKDVSEMYARTILPGKLIINKRSVLITSQSATKTYDGSALTRPAVTITGDGFVPGELAKAEATGSITNVGSTPNTIRYTTTGAFNAANYSIALSVGTLTVTEKPKPEPRRTFNLTISYVYQNGKRAAASYNRGGLKNGETFDITSPVIAGYTASETVVSGTIYNRDIKVTVIYTADGVNLDDYGVPLGLGNITMNVGDCFE